jgi:hypothetical protein
MKGRVIAMVVGLAALLAMPASAQGAFSVTGTAAPADTSAGAHSDFHIHMGFSGGQVKDLTIGLPPGLVGDPNAAPQCTQEEFDATNCPADTVVGSVSASATILGVVGSVPATGNLYNFAPQPGEPARFAIILHPLGVPGAPAIKLQSAVQLRGDYGLDTIITDIPNSTLLSGDTTIDSQDITLFGTAPGTGKPFMRNPTSCGEKTVTISATPYSGSASTASPTFTTENCGAEDFSPSFSALVGGPGQTASGVPTTVVTSIDQDPDEAGLVKAEVTVPADFNPNSSILFNDCTPSEFQAGSCPPASVVGSAVAASPLLSQPLSGPVELVSTGGTFPDIGLDLRGQLHLLLRGTLDITKKTTFDNLPDIPIAHFQLTFSSSPGLLGNSRDLCTGGPPVFHADFHGYNGASTSVDSPATVQGCGPTGPLHKAKCKKKKRKHRAAQAKKKRKHCKKKRKRR